MASMKSKSSGRDPRLDLLASAITQKAPYCGGTVVVPEDHLMLFYTVDNTNNAKVLDMARATQDELRSLARACQVATLSVNQQVVLPESCSNTGKLDSSRFSVRLGEGTVQKLLDIIHPELLQGRDDTKTIEAELYKLDVYGEGSFVKAHRDTSLSDGTFGSLVITFPTPHEGGALVLRHDGQEWTHDPSKLLQPQDDRIAYVAFYGDIEHEVLPVTVGHCVTLTYNLYLGGAKTHAQGVRPANRPHEEVFAKQLRTLLANPMFLPTGGFLGFGLQRAYPVPANGDVTGMEAHLKGAEAAVMAMCKAAGLKVQVKLCYTDVVTVLRDIALPEGTWPPECVEDMVDYFLSGEDGMIVDSDDQDEYAWDGLRVQWVTPLTELTQVQTLAGVLDGDVCYVYGNACLIVEVPGAQERSIPA